MSEARMNCADCEELITDPGNPCPRCGSTRRNATVIAAPASARAWASIPEILATWFIPHRSWSKRRQWGSSGTRCERGGLGRLVRFHDEYDKDADRRLEHVEDDATGEVIHHTDHPLTEHKGHGSAKPKPDGDH
jgi:hypothetical protein